MRKRGIDLRLVLALLLLVVAAGVIALFAVGGSSASKHPEANLDAQGVLSPATAAPAKYVTDVQR